MLIFVGFSELQAIHTMESPNKFQTRCVSLLPDTNGFALGAIDSRASVHYFDTSQARYMFSFII